MKIRFVPTFVLATCLALVGCSSNTRPSVKSDVENATNSAAETVARTIATQQGEEQFKNAQHELTAPLKCTAKVQSNAAKIDIACSGATKDAKAATLRGTTSELPGASVVSLNGTFVGSVDGTEVFTTQRLGG
jgi:ABC-type enterochelin transport system substrate-binding protein